MKTASGLTASAVLSPANASQLNSQTATVEKKKRKSLDRNIAELGPSQLSVQRSGQLAKSFAVT